MNILMTGSGGLVGSALRIALEQAGHTVGLLRRGRASSPSETSWDPATGRLEGGMLEEVDAVVHLAGESIAGRRWTPAQKQRIRDSRVDATRKLCESLAALKDPPKVFLGASAVGIYGDRGDEKLDEESAPGHGFLVDVARDWEAATHPMEALPGTRIAALRFGIVLDPAGGALKAMLPIFRLGLGGPLGAGRQWWSWISLEDAVRAILLLLQEPLARGAFNLVSPQPVTNREFTRALGKALHRPAFLPAPEVALRMVLGGMADGLLLASARALPSRLQALGFEWRHPEIAPALLAILSPNR